MHRPYPFSKFFDAIREYKKWVVTTTIALAIIMAGLWGGRYMLYAMGTREVYLAAKENDYCRDEACQEGMGMLVAMLERETGIPANLVPWCMAANAIYTTQFGSMNRLKDKFADWMYQSCGHDDITVEDIVLSIGEPEDHD